MRKIKKEGGTAEANHKQKRKLRTRKKYNLTPKYKRNAEQKVEQIKEGPQRQ